MTHPIINADDITRVALNFMNHTHEEEADLVNELGKVIKKYSSDESIKSKISLLLDQWLDHTKAHFSRENELMDETGFPAYPMHKNEHEVALRRLQTVIDMWEKNSDIGLLEDYIFTLWPAWFKGHIGSMDLMTAKFAVMNGYTEAQT